MSSDIISIPSPAFRLRPAVRGFALTLPLLLAGCGSLTGLDASSSFSCPMTPGTACRSLSDTYDDAVHGRAPDQVARAEAEEAVRAAAEAAVRQAETASAEVAEDPPARVTPPETPSPKGRPSGAAASNSAPASRIPVPETRAPHRLPEVIVTIWMAPWTDDEGDFHEGERIHARAFDSRWASARRRAENTQGRRAVVQLPFARRAPAAAAEPAAAEPEPLVTGEGAARLSEARRGAFEGVRR